ncbi:MAG: TonB-dependent receptor [Flaviaesturariibacter sp.]|nr:TonB-dependent receptor [Flaviaesturariibacter sp.]
MLRTVLPVIFLFIFSASFAQGTGDITVLVKEDGRALAGATIELRTAKKLVRIGVSDSSGITHFTAVSPGVYTCAASLVGFAPALSDSFRYEGGAVVLPVLFMKKEVRLLAGVTVQSRKPLIELRSDRTIVNLESSISQVGTSVLEALEKMPGITVDKDGVISLKGKSSVLVMIDGKPTYLGGAELANLLGGMSSSGVSQVELMTQPPARYDASGNAGVINIRTKKTQVKGWNGSVNVSVGKGRYPKSNNSVQVNYRMGKVNLFANYSLNANGSFTRIYALRQYYKADERTIERELEQPTFIRARAATHTLRTGIDYSLGQRTTLGLALSGSRLSRHSDNTATASWKQPSGAVDSLIETFTGNASRWRSGGLSASVRHSFKATGQLGADVDVLSYRIHGTQMSSNVRRFPGNETESFRGNLPSSINIYSARADYSDRLSKTVTLETGWKSSRIVTDNEAAYELLDGGAWKTDAGKTNHFIYTENIHALYATTQASGTRWSGQGGLRFERTSYKGHQLGNDTRKDSAFSRNYNSLFPSASVSYRLDSSNSLSASIGRRIDRPAFQKLNPFVFIINKYTNQQGNPYFRPQFTWNAEVAHLYRSVIVSTLSYSVTTDYFSQIFYSDSAGVVVYTEGNLGRARNLGVSVAVQLSLRPWWSLNGQATGNSKRIEGIVYGKAVATISQGQLSLSNTFRFKKGWGAELSGFYTTRSQADLQEVVDPSGQMTAGLSKTVASGRGTFRLVVRDIFYTQAMAGNTTFFRSGEYFKLTRDTRVATFGFTLRFGRALKGTPRRSEGSAKDEIQRVGNG